MLHDGYTDLIYVMLPIWQAEFGLGYAALGLLRGLFSGTMAGLQIPSALVAERLGTAAGARARHRARRHRLLPGRRQHRLLDADGRAVRSAALGASTQHPLGSALVARAFAGPRSLKALGTYNFAGDIGKMTVPAAASLLLVVMPWRPALALLGALGLASAVGDLLAGAALPAEAVADSRGEGCEPRRPAAARALRLSAAAVDRHARQRDPHGLPDLPAVRARPPRAPSLPTVGLALTLVFAGGAAGKLVCAFIGARIGVIATVWLTEGLTAARILALLPLPLEAAWCCCR